MNKSVCAYCGDVGELTKDHVPPKSLFQKPLPSNLITVPACQGCHNNISIDDEYFLMALGVVFSDDKGENAHFLTDKIKRALRRPEANKLRIALRNSAKPIERHSYRGIYLGKGYAIPFDWKRIKGFARRILVGLHFHEFGSPVPDGYNSSVRLSWLSKDNTVLNLPEVKELLAILSHSKKVSIGNNGFQYWMARADDDPCVSVWYIRIAEEFGFMGFIDKKIS